MATTEEQELLFWGGKIFSESEVMPGF